MEIKTQADLSVAAIRATVIDVTNKANSGHPGMALDAAPAMYALYRDHLVADPAHPEWINRDRLVWSSGHASALCYTLLHVAGYDVTIDDLKSFRQLESRTPGHPEVGMTPGIDATSGPLGQGIAQAVGMAIAEKAIASEYPEGGKIMNHMTYCLCGDGCLEEGISQEAISLAGHLHLNKLVLIYDENQSTLDGPTTDSFTENVEARFLASEWDVIDVKDGNDIASVSKAIAKAKKSLVHPTLIIIHTKIGFGSQRTGDHSTHGMPLGAEDGAYAKKQYGYTEPEFAIPASVYEDLKASFGARGKAAYKNYEGAFFVYQAMHAHDAERFLEAFDRNNEAHLPAKRDFSSVAKEATRASGGKFISALHAAMPWSFGGSADVAGSTKTNIAGEPIFSFEHPESRDIHWGIREFAMCACQNGILLHGGLSTYIATFFVFSDYMKGALRLAALQQLPAVYLFTHDSLAVGEDGATHQPIEQLAMLRAMPGIDVIRPADARESEGALRYAFAKKKGPTAVILTRQDVPTLEKSDGEMVKKGAYCVYAPEEKAEAMILATGSEVALAIDAAKLLKEKGIAVKVVSFPCFECYEALKPEEKAEILDLPYEKRVSLEMLSTFGWAKYAPHNIGIDTFGASGKDKDVLAHFGFTKEAVTEKVASFLSGK